MHQGFPLSVKWETESIQEGGPTWESHPKGKGGDTRCTQALKWADDGKSLLNLLRADFSLFNKRGKKKRNHPASVPFYLEEKIKTEE